MVEVLGSTSPDIDLRRRVATSVAAAPELIDIEVLDAVRKNLRRGHMDEKTADAVAQDLQVVPIARSPHRILIKRVWELRHSVTAYDAAYVALAEELDVPLVTCDAKLAGSNSHNAKIELYPAC